jgi:predicted nucleotidyltransferase component of viral defense system
MIHQKYIREWEKDFPWKDIAQVEQDLIISRAIVQIFSDDLLRNSLAFRGGTALHKLYITHQSTGQSDNR